MPGITVKELKEALNDLPDDILVVVHSDWSANDVELTEEEWEQIKNETPRVLVIYP